MLRNRITGEKFDEAGQPIKQKTSIFFTTPAFVNNIAHLLKPIKNKIPNLFPFVEKTLREIDSFAINDQKKTELAKKFVKFCCEHSLIINELSKDPEELQRLCEAYTPSVQQENGRYQPPSFLFDLFKKLSLSALGNYSPLGAFFAAIVLPAAGARASDIQINSGVPSGGVDLCGSANMYCTQGYLSNDTTGEVIAQFSRTLSAIFAGGRSGDFPVLLLDCLSLDEVGNTTANFFEKGYTNGTAICTATSVPYIGYTATIQSTNLPETACSSFQQAFNPLLTQCMNEVNSMQTIVGAAIGGSIAVLAVAAAVAILSYKTECCRKKPSF